MSASVESNALVKAQRQRIIHRIIHSYVSHSTNSARCVVHTVARSGVAWPEAMWPGARKGLPDYQQALNYMKQLRCQGKLEYRRETGYWVSIVEPEPEERHMRNRAAEALQLQSEGLNGTQIAERMEISNSLAYGLLNDPYGDKERERKKMYCPVCGSKKEGSVDWCRKCKTAKIENLLPPKDFMRFAHRAFRDQGLHVVFGVTPDCERVIRIGTDRGMIEHKLSSHESWDDAVQKVGLA